MTGPLPFAPGGPDVLCIGSVLWDIIGRAPGAMALGDDRPGRIRRDPGGVALNIAVNLARHGLRPAVLSAVGRDEAGADLLAACARKGVITDHLHHSQTLPTDCYMAIEGPDGLIAALADAHTLEAAGAQILRPLADGRLGQADAPWAGLIVLDGNLPADLLAEIAVSPLFARADLRIAPASAGKAERLRPLIAHPRAILYVNRHEAAVLCATLFDSAAQAAQALLDRGAARVLVTDGAQPAADGRAGADLLTALPPPVPVNRITGAGDAFMAAHLAAEHRGADRTAALRAALAAAAAHVSGEITP